jgi:hypothetical protein
MRSKKATMKPITAIVNIAGTILTMRETIVGRRRITESRIGPTLALMSTEADTDAARPPTAARPPSARTFRLVHAFLIGVLVTFSVTMKKPYIGLYLKIPPHIIVRSRKGVQKNEIHFLVYLVFTKTINKPFTRSPSFYGQNIG